MPIQTLSSAIAARSWRVATSIQSAAVPHPKLLPPPIMKRLFKIISLLLVVVATGAFHGTAAQQPITLNDVEEGLPQIRADEPMAAVFSAEKAAMYLDRSALNWQKTKKC